MSGATENTSIFIRRATLTNTLAEAWAFVMGEVDHIPAPTVEIRPVYRDTDESYAYDVSVSGFIKT
ncbi:MAG: hypothetical protein P0Y48_01405 [Candidatus Microbacterium phytovorans]|uniref:Uncharacterized protein n=1 Tax=Candidatus Microbacterium phytovorans TaxID=3121374 RepID=A0AAJ6B429_9MICO|nr:hypothetical protein [Microbacterium sp.]WEK13897.1 MAG: hypothetical protein P0Y48_01405 [Microbacterium sp.]